MDRKMFKAVKTGSALAGDVLSTWFSLLVKFPSPVMFATGCCGQKNKVTAKSILADQLAALLSRWRF